MSAEAMMKDSLDNLELPVEFSNLRHHDHRGFFQERFSNLDSQGIHNCEIVQENLSSSHRGVLRGWHWQIPPLAQGKLVTCVNGAILDACLDLRLKSPIFGEILTFELDSTKLNSLWIPVGFAHAFQALTDNTLVFYSTTSSFSSELSRAINPLDHSLPIEWPIADPILSEKDANAPLFTELPEADLF